MNFIEKLYKKRKIAKQLIKTYTLGGFDAIEDSLAKLCNEHEDFAIYFFKYFNGLYENDVEFFRNVMESQKIVISSNILRASIYNKYLPMYFANYRNRLTKEQIISILNENFSFYYSDNAENLFTIMRYHVLGDEYNDLLNALIIKFPTYESAYYIVCAIERSSDYSDKMIDAMIATNNLDAMIDLRAVLKIRDVDIPKKLEDKIEELEKKKDEKLRKKIEKYDKELEKYQDKPEEYTAEYIEKQKRKLKQSQDKLQASVNNL